MKKIMFSDTIITGISIVACNRFYKKDRPGAVLGLKRIPWYQINEKLGVSLIDKPRQTY